MKINKRIIAKFNPCKDRFDNYVKHYGSRTFDVSEFIDLDKITHSDKLWVLLRLAKRETIEVFALDCAIDAYSAADAAYAAAAYAAYTAASNAAAAAAGAAGAGVYSAADAAYAAIYTAGAGVYTASKQRKEQEQLECLLWLIQNEGK